MGGHYCTKCTKMYRGDYIFFTGGLGWSGATLGKACKRCTSFRAVTLETKTCETPILNKQGHVAT